LKVLDLFCGCGGLSLGLEQAGFQISLGVDIWNDALETFQHNHRGSKAIRADLSNLNFDSLGLEQVDVIVGGPPCQGFSISGRRDPNDPRNKLYTGFVNAVKAYNPKAFIMENVPNLASMNGGRIKDTIVSEFESLGYTISYKKILASEYGIPQNRRRFILVGLRNGQEFSFPEETHTNKKITCEEAISDLPEFSVTDGSKYKEQPNSDYQRIMRLNSSGVFNHQITNHTEKTVKTISLVPDGGNYKDLPDELKSSRKVNIAWTRFSSKKPSFTIDTGHRHHFHYEFNRVPTVRESARLQSFPDNFIFLGSKTSQYKQVGNAVPPLLGKALGEKLVHFLAKGGQNV
jgi:DNA (cytosine-5)-methyltransferase 1